MTIPVATPRAKLIAKILVQKRAACFHVISPDFDDDHNHPQPYGEGGEQVMKHYCEGKL
jgi:Cu/Zn superoxide dismutase